MTTAATVAYYADDGEVRLSYAGHPPVLFKRRTENTWSFATPYTDTEAAGPLKDLPLAVAPDALYEELGMPVASGDRLFVYTDGVTEAPSPDRDLFGGGRLKRVLDANPDLPLAGVKSAVLHALRQHTDSELVHDDVTFITLEIS
jgi:sigma-B regulation protein RsbU (phosphoserine phosphatase)